MDNQNDSSQIELGPFSEIDFDLLKAKLDAAKISFTHVADQDAVLAYQEKMRERNHRIRWTKAPPPVEMPEFIYIKMAKDQVLIIKAELDKMGYSLTPKDPEPDHDDFVCPKCGYTSDQPGLCPKHRIELKEYFAMIHEEPEASILGRIFVVAIIAVFIYAFFWATRSKAAEKINVVGESDVAEPEVLLKIKKHGKFEVQGGTSVRPGIARKEVSPITFCFSSF